MFLLSSRGEEHHIPALRFTANRKEPGLRSADMLVVAVGSLHAGAVGSLGKLEPGSPC